MRKALRALKKFAKRLGSKGAARTPEEIRATLLEVGSAVQADLQAMIDS